MSPEQTWGQPTTTATDVWSMGVVLFEMLTGRLPSPGPDAVMVHQIRHDPPLSLSQFVSAPAALERAISKALDKDPARRHRSVAEFARAIQAAMSTDRRATPTPPPDTEEDPEPWKPPTLPKLRRQGLLAALFVVLVAALSLAVVMFRNNGGDGGVVNRRPVSVQVPDVKDDSLDNAQSRLKNFHVQLRQTDSIEAKGKILGTDPAAGTKVNRGSSVTLLISKGPQSPSAQSLPSVKGQTVEQAKQTLKGFDVHWTGQLTDRVTATVPKEGSPVSHGAKVTLLVYPSPPPPPPALVKVPLVYGRDWRTAKRMLVDQGFQVKVIPRSSSKRKGLVVQVDPWPEAKAGGLITLCISSGPARKARNTVPSVKGLNVNRAWNKLGDMHFTVIRQWTNSSKPFKTVLGTDPKEGQAPYPGNRVYLQLSNGVP